MAKVLNYESQIQQGEVVQSWHVSQSVDAFTGVEDYAISISGSLNLTSSFSIAPGNLLTTGQCQYLSYNPTTGQVFRADTASISDNNFIGGFQVYQTGSSINNIVPAKFGNNKASTNYAVVAGGINNTASGEGAFIGAGTDNANYGACGFLGAGERNIICTQGGDIAQHAAIVGGILNTASDDADRSFIGGGSCNYNQGLNSVIVGGVLNRVSNANSGIVGGSTNLVSGQFSFIGGGCNNNTNLTCTTTIVGGNSNTISDCASFSFIGAGCCNKICSKAGLPNYCACFASIVGGERNVIGNGEFNAEYSIIGGGQLNTASSLHSGILGGCCNLVCNNHSFIIGSNLTSSNVCTTSVNNLFISGALRDYDNEVGVDGYILTSKGSGCVKWQANTGGGNEGFHVYRTGSLSSAIEPVIGANANSGSAAVINGGCCNFITEFSGCSVIGGGICNTSSTSTMNVIAGGCRNIICSCNSLIGGGTMNCVSITGLGGYGVIVGGSANCIVGASKSYNIIGNGSGNCITEADGSVIGSGASNKITKGNCNAIITGFNNCVETSTSGCSIILVGRANKVSTGYSVLGSGCSNLITGSGLRYHFMGTGCENIISGSTNSYSVIVGGQNNSSSANNTFIGSGKCNHVNSCYSAIVGGLCHTISGNYENEFIGGGFKNTISAYGGNTIVGGSLNSLSARCNFIGGGQQNTISGYGFASIVGGCLNTIGSYSQNFIGGGGCNTISNYGSYRFLGGGFCNTISSCYVDSEVLVGGLRNTISTRYGLSNFIGGGACNTISGQYKCYTAIVAGIKNTGSADQAFIGGGCLNKISGSSATGAGSRGSSILGGRENFILSSSCGFIGGGQFNHVSGSLLSSIVGGSRNSASAANYSFVGGGRNNQISGSGHFSGILAGDENDLAHEKAFIVGSDIISHAACTTHVNHFTVSGSAGGSSCVIMRGLPTADPNILGQLWVDSTAGYALKVSQG